MQAVEKNEMKAPAKAKRASKRDLFAELTEGMKALAQVREGKRTLRTHAAEFHELHALGKGRLR